MTPMIWNRILRLSLAGLASLALHALSGAVMGQVNLAHEPRQTPINRPAALEVSLVTLPNGVNEPSVATPSPSETLSRTVIPAFIPALIPALIPFPFESPPHDSRPDRHYFRSHELYLTPSPRSPIAPPYPAEAKNQKGRVVLLLLINADGELDHVSIVESSPVGVFDNSAVAAFKSAKFSPGIRDNQAVPSQQTIEIIYSPGLFGDLPQEELARKPVDKP